MRRVALVLAVLASGCPAPPRGPCAISSARAVSPPRAFADAGAAPGEPVAITLPSGLVVTPSAAPGSQLVPLDPREKSAPDFRAGGSMSLARSPDGKTLALLTSGFNKRYAWRKNAPHATPETLSDEHVFVWDTATLAPRAIVRVPNSFVGLAFAPDGGALWVSGGPDDRVIPIDTKTWTAGAPIELHHRDAKGYGGRGFQTGPLAAGVAVTARGALLVANHDNDTLSVIDPRSGASTEINLWPGGGRPGGASPYSIATSGDRVFVTCQRDHEVVELDAKPDGTGVIKRRFPTGALPTRARVHEGTLWIANATSDTLTAIDLKDDQARTVDVGVGYKGASPNDLAVAPDGRVFVTLGGINAIGVVSKDRLVGMIPTGAYPSAIETDGARLFVAFGKSAPGPNPRGPWTDRARAERKPYDAQTADEFSLQLMRGALHVLPIPNDIELTRLTELVRKNARIAERPTTTPIFEKLRGKVKHVIYVIGENRTFDQIFGDMGGGDPSLLLWGEAITPNQHALARGNKVFDRFFDAGGVSGDGWQWSVAGRTSDADEREVPIEYAERGRRPYEWEGRNRNINVGLATTSERLAWNPNQPTDVDLLPGASDFAQPGPYLWDSAIAAKLTVRNYGFFIDDMRYPKHAKNAVPVLRDPRAQKTRVAFPTAASLIDKTDEYFRGYDNKLADFWRVKEWMNEMDEHEKKGELPALELVRLMHDHFGSFDEAEDGVDTPDTQIADHDYAIGMLVERLARSPFWESTIVVVLEADAQNGSDHVSAQRSFVLFAGGHAARGGEVVHTRYATPSALRTIELLLGVEPLALTDAFAAPIEEALSEDVAPPDFRARVPAVLRSTKLPLPASSEVAKLPRGTAAEWARATAGMSFDHEDQLPDAFNDVLRARLAASAPAP